MIRQVSSFSSVESDPLRNFKFQVNFLPVTGPAAPPMGFMTCSGLSMQLDVIAYRQGGANSVTTKMPGQGDFGQLTFTNGIIAGGSSAAQWQVGWMMEIVSVIQGAAPGGQSPLGSAGSAPSGLLPDFRQTAQLLILEHPATSPSAAVQAMLTLYRCWPCQLSYADLDAGANQLWIAEMVLAYEGFNIGFAASPGSDASIPAST